MLKLKSFNRSVPVYDGPVPCTNVHTNKICFKNQFIFNLVNKCHRSPLYSRPKSIPKIVPSVMNLTNMHHPQVLGILRLTILKGNVSFVHAWLNHKVISVDQCHFWSSSLSIRIEGCIWEHLIHNLCSIWKFCFQ